VRKNNGTGAFTVIELLVVTSIISLLAAISFPVYRNVLGATKRAVCIRNFNSIGTAMMMYVADYDERVPPVNYKYANVNNPGEDRTWVQTLAPYAGDFRLFTCPGDTGRDSAGTPSGWEGYYAASLRSNLGYNYLYLSPLVQDATGTWASHPRSMSEIASVSRTITFIDSVWDRTQSGQPTGGGSWVTVPPCRFIKLASGVVVDSFGLPGGTRNYFGFSPVGWQPSSSLSWLVYGGAWPWHSGKFTVGFADGHVDTLVVDELTAGCEFDAGWRGLIVNTSSYLWDLND
jgi:prepilin-type processing-associated H-X9-DG protein